MEEMRHDMVLTTDEAVEYLKISGSSGYSVGDELDTHYTTEVDRVTVVI